MSTTTPCSSITRLGSRAGNILAGALVIAAACAAAGLAARRLAPAEQAPIASAIERGAQFLASVQQPDGSFIIDYCTDAAMTQCVREASVYGAAVARYSLDGVPGAAAGTVRARAAALLRAERTPDGLWRYLARSQPGHLAFPPDLDDTALGALALSRDGIEFAGLPELLERYALASGLYPTWVRDADPQADPAVSARFTSAMQFQNVDCGVNANLLAYLGSRRPAPALCAHLNEVVASGLHPSCSVYGLTRPGLGYAIARAYAAGAGCLSPSLPALRQTLRRAQQADGTWGHALDTALAVNALLAAGDDPGSLRQAQRALIRWQRDDGGWPRGAYYQGYKIPMVYGSEELTTAFAVEALGRFQGMAGEAQ